MGQHNYSVVISKRNAVFGYSCGEKYSPVENFTVHLEEHHSLDSSTEDCALTASTVNHFRF